MVQSSPDDASSRIEHRTLLPRSVILHQLDKLVLWARLVRAGSPRRPCSNSGGAVLGVPVRGHQGQQTPQSIL